MMDCAEKIENDIKNMSLYVSDLSDHCLIACVRNGTGVKRPPLISVKRCLKHFSEQAFLNDLNAISWSNINLIPSVEDAWLYFKIFEKLVNNQIVSHLESHRILSAMQSGFRAGHGCTTATLKVLNDIIAAIDKKQYCAAVYIDLSKAFDSVNHRVLISRLNSLGFSHDCLAWFSNYLSDRVQRVKSEGLLSGPMPVSIGVPQGSILGLTLFSLYINDVALAAAISVKDDILIAAPSAKDHDEILRKVIQAAQLLNFDKCHIKQSSVPYMGHLITSDGLRADHAKIEAVKSMPKPADKDGVRRFLGFVNDLSKFLPNLSKVDASLRQLLKDNGQKQTMVHNMQRMHSRISAKVMESCTIHRPHTCHTPAVRQSMQSRLLRNFGPRHQNNTLHCLTTEQRQ
ncbi:hypothetical protein PO909_016143 [Leuciscus waleckii]